MRSDDFRYHIASLAAVFFALGIGILIGTAFVGAPVVERQIRALNRTLSTSVNELGRRREEAEKNEEALRVLLPGLVQGKLAGRSVLVVRTGDYPDAAVQARAALELAGASVAEITLPVDAWRSLIAPMTSPSDTSAATGADSAMRELERLARALVRPPRPNTNVSVNPSADRPGEVPMIADVFAALRERDLVRGEAPQSAQTLVVVVGGAKPPPVSTRVQTPIGVASPGSNDGELRRRVTERAETIEWMNRTLARTWTTENRGVGVVGVAPVEADTASLRAFRDAAIATVDNIDRAAGQIALPFALLGEKAAYGIKDGSERVLPTSLSERALAPAAATPDGPLPVSPTRPPVAPARAVPDRVP